MSALGLRFVYDVSKNHTSDLLRFLMMTFLHAVGCMEMDMLIKTAESDCKTD